MKFVSVYIYSPIVKIHIFLWNENINQIKLWWHNEICLYCYFIDNIDLYMFSNNILNVCVMILQSMKKENELNSLLLVIVKN